jgi:hypothetical protein
VQSYDCDSRVQNVTVSGANHVISALSTAIEFNGSTTNSLGSCAESFTGGVIDGNTFDTPRQGSRTAVIRNTTGTTFSNNTIGAFNASALSVGPTGGGFLVQRPTITGNTFNNINNGGVGIVFGDVNCASVTGTNVFNPRASTTTSVAFSLLTGTAPTGTYNSTMTGNNVSAVTSATKITCAPAGQSNAVNSNTGASDCVAPSPAPSC